jgi:hypothetical protein
VLDAADADEEPVRQHARLEQCARWQNEAEKLCEQNIAALLELGNGGHSAEAVAKPTGQKAQGRGPEDCTAAGELDALIRRLALQRSWPDATSASARSPSGCTKRKAGADWGLLRSLSMRGSGSG